MNRSILCLSLASLLVPTVLAQSPSLSTSAEPINSAETSADKVHAATVRKSPTQEVQMHPFSQLGVGVGFSLMGINLQAATNINQNLNLRAAGNIFKYTENNISTKGFNIDAKLNMGTAGLSLDYYPFPTRGLRISPGLLFYNQNTVSADVTVEDGGSFRLNHVTYYSSSANPVQGTAGVGFNAQNPAFTLTTGWGNMISRKGKHLSFPFELGAAFVNTPTVSAALTKGQVCDAAGANCQDVALDTALQSDLQAEIAKYKHDLDPLKVYPIVSIGVSYRFGIR
jgi:hypothetical protein